MIVDGSPVSLAAIAWGHAARRAGLPGRRRRDRRGRDARRAGRRAHRAPVADALADRGGESDRDRRGGPPGPRRWRTVAAGARIAARRGQPVDKGPPGAKFAGNSWISPYPAARAVGYRWPCSKGPWTESSVADANQRCWLRTSGSFGRFCVPAIAESERPGGGGGEWPLGDRSQAIRRTSPVRSCRWRSSCWLRPVPIARPFVLAVLVGGVAVAIRRDAPVRWAWAAPIPVAVSLCWALLPVPPVSPSGADCASITSPTAVWRTAEAGVVIGTLAVLAWALRVRPVDLRRDLLLRMPARAVVRWSIVGFLVAGPVALVLGPILARPFFGEIDVRRDAGRGRRARAAVRGGERGDGGARLPRCTVGLVGPGDRRAGRRSSGRRSSSGWRTRVRTSPARHLC